MLSVVNPNNKHINEARIPDQIIKLDTPVSLLDESLGIVSISKSHSRKLENQCFITFEDHEGAKSFKDVYSSLKIRGKLVDIHVAKKESFISMANNNINHLNHILKRKKYRQTENYTLKRKLRRIRSKLRAKNMKEEEINKVVDTIKKNGIKRTTAKENLAPKDTKKKKEETSNVVKVTENPPNNVLLVQNLPKDITEEELSTVFKSDNLVEIRLVNIRNLAFVEYDSIKTASAIMGNLGNVYKFDGYEISIGFAK